MENFIVSARKYRPTTFDNVVGQQSITSTLKNAIKSIRLLPMIRRTSKSRERWCA